jgi:hypothetical protein
MDSFTERLELPDGQYAVFRTRIGYAGTLAIRKALVKDENDIVFVDAVLRAFLIKATIKDFETGELLVNVEPDAIARGETDTIDLMQVRALEIYLAWKAESAPKVTAATEPESAASETSRSSPPRARSKRKTTT